MLSPLQNKANKQKPKTPLLISITHMCMGVEHEGMSGHTLKEELSLPQQLIAKSPLERRGVEL